MSDYFDSWNKSEFSLNNSNLQEFTRDYDKNPIILENYEYIIYPCISAFFIFFGASFIFIKDYFMPNFNKETISLVGGIIFLIVPFFVTYIVFNLRDKNNKIYIKNDEIIFFNIKDKCKFKREIKLNKNYEFYKPFSTSVLSLNLSVVIFFFFIVLGYCIIIFIDKSVAILLFLIFLAYILSNIIFKLFLFNLINSAFNYFSLFPIICIDEPIYPDKHANPSPPRHYYIFLYNKAKKEEVKKYFCDRFNIHIDKIKKKF